MDPEEMKTLKESLNESGKKAVETAVKELETKHAEEMAEAKRVTDEALKTAQELTVRIEAIEKMKSSAVDGFNINTIDPNFKFNGRTFNVVKTMERGDHVSDTVNNSINPKRFGIFNNEEKYFDYQKYMRALLTTVAYHKTNPEIVRELNRVKEELKDSPIFSHQKAAMVEGTTTVGGFGVPDEFSNELLLLAREASFALRECRVIGMGSDTLNFTREDQGFTVYYPGENTAITASNFTQGQVQLKATKAAILSDVVSNELIEDTIFDLVGYITEASGYAMGQSVDSEVLNGLSATWVANVGLLTSIITQEREVTGADADSFAGLTDNDVSHALQTLSPADQANAKLVINKLGHHYIRTLKDVNGQPIFAAPSVQQVPATVYGVPIIVSTQITNTDAADTSFAVIGDLKKMIIARRSGGFTLDTDPYTGFAEDTTRFRMKLRYGLGLGRVSAFVRISTTA